MYCGELSTPAAELGGGRGVIGAGHVFLPGDRMVQLNGAGGAPVLQVTVARAAGTICPSATPHCWTSYAATFGAVHTATVAQFGLVFRVLVVSVKVTLVVPGPVVCTATMKLAGGGPPTQ